VLFEVGSEESMDSSEDTTREYERQSWMLARILLQVINEENAEEGPRPFAISIRGLIFALAWCLAQGHVEAELTDGDYSIELVTRELRLRVPEIEQFLRRGRA
jgi:hypothetical protein